MQTEVVLTTRLFSFQLAGGFSHLSISVHDAYMNDIVGLVDDLQVF